MSRLSQKGYITPFEWDSSRGTKYFKSIGKLTLQYLLQELCEYTEFKSLNLPVRMSNMEEY